MIWPWARIIELEGALAMQERELESIRQELQLERAEESTERHRRIGAEALAAERKEECQRLREDLAASRLAEKEARDLMAKTLVEANVRLTTPLQDPPPDMNKIREMAALRNAEDITLSRRKLETRVMADVLRKFNYPGFGPKSTAPAVAEENPPGEGERPSLNAVG